MEEEGWAALQTAVPCDIQDCGLGGTRRAPRSLRERGRLVEVGGVPGQASHTARLGEVRILPIAMRRGAD